MSFQTPSGRIEPGQPLSQAISARAWNRAQDAADIVLSNSQQMLAGGSRQPAQPYTFVYLKNTTGTDVSRWQAIAIEGVEGAPLGSGGSSSDAALSQFVSMPVLRGTTPDGGKKCAIALEPIKAGAVGRVAIAGVVQAVVSATTETQNCGWAKMPSGSFGSLESVEFGDIEILWRDSGTGDKWALVRIGGQRQVSRLCKTTQAWSKNTIATLDVWESGSAASETHETGKTLVGAINKFTDVAAGKFVIVSPVANGEWYLIAAEC